MTLKLKNLFGVYINTYKIQNVDFFINYIFN